MPDNDGSLGAVGSFAPVIAAITPKPVAPPARRVLTLNIAFEAGVTDRRILLAYIGNLQDAIDAYVKANGGADIKIGLNIQEKAIAVPSEGKWDGARQSLAAVTGIKGTGEFNVLIVGDSYRSWHSLATDTVFRQKH